MIDDTVVVSERSTHFSFEESVYLVCLKVDRLHNKSERVSDSVLQALFPYREKYRLY